jgi:UDP-N-acetylglucosamine 2-epimerase (non-hydrolysing)
MKEVLQHHMPQIMASSVLELLDLEKEGYYLVSAHREENLDDASNFSNLIASLEAVAEEFDLPVIVSTHPRTHQRLEQSGSHFGARIRFLKPFGFLDYVKLELNARCVISDSGTITEESSILGFPAVTIRQAHERPEGMDEGTLIMCGLKPERVIEAVKTVVQQQSRRAAEHKVVPDYDTADVSRKVVRIILSYTDYINRTVWHK